MHRLSTLLSVVALTSIASAASAQGQNYVSPHTRSDGSQVQGHYRTNPNNTMNDNWTTRGNTNPHTGQDGYRSPNPSYGSGPTYGSGQRSNGSSYGYGR